MLTLLTIRDFAVVSAIELEFGRGLTVISGETGAGKSLLVDALGFLSGLRADSGMVRIDADTNLGVSVSTDCNGRYAYLDPYRGAQLALAVQNVEDVLAGAGMTLSNVVRLKVYTTDVEALMPAYGTLAAKLGQARVSPPNTLVEVSRLAVPGLLVELEVTAAD